MGRPGTGKSTQAAAVAESLGWPHLASDRIRRTHADVPYVFVELTAEEDATASDARASDFEMLTERYEAPDTLEDPRHVRIGPEGAPDQTTLKILKTLIRLAD